MTKKIITLNQKEINMISGGISKKILDLTDTAAALALGGLTALFAPVVVTIGGPGAALLGFGVSCFSFWAVPNISAMLTKPKQEIK